MLPAGYRQRWEEDMVSAFMDAASTADRHANGRRSGRLALAERFSVVSLAVRVWFNGSHATPRGQVWYHGVHALALMSLLYQALAETLLVANTARFVVKATVDGRGNGPSGPLILEFFIWSQGLGLLWVAALACFVVGHLVAARVLVLFAMAAKIGVPLALYGYLSLSDVPSLAGWGWLVVSVALVLVSAPNARASRRLWLVAYLAGALTLVPVTLLHVIPTWNLIRVVTLTTAATAALNIGMAVVLVLALVGRPRDPGRPLSSRALARNQR